MQKFRTNISSLDFWLVFSLSRKILVICLVSFQAWSSGVSTCYYYYVHAIEENTASPVPSPRNENPNMDEK